MAGTVVRAAVAVRLVSTAPAEPPGHVRGVDVLRLRDGKVGREVSYVKG